MADRLYRSGIFLAEGNEYPEPNPGCTPVYPWAGAPTSPNQPLYNPPSARSGLDHALGGENEALGGLNDSILNRHGLKSKKNVAGNVHVNPDSEFVLENSM